MPDQQRQARQYNRAQLGRAVLIVGMSVWTAYTTVWVFAPMAWPESARMAFVAPLGIALAVWLTSGIRGVRRD